MEHKEVEDNYSETHHAAASSFLPLDFPSHQAQILRQQQEPENTGIEMVDYMLGNQPEPQQHQISFADVMQFADFGPKLALNQSRSPNDNNEEGEESFFFKWNLVHEGGAMQQQQQQQPPILSSSLEEGVKGGGEEEEGRFSENNSSVQQIGGQVVVEVKGTKRKRARTMKTSEEVESQRMTHIAVERNRRRQMNEHLRVLRGLMPGSYVQRGDQASIIGGAIEFVRELEQLLQCLESQKRRRLFGGNEPPRNMADAQLAPMQQQTGIVQQQQPFFPPLSLPCNSGSGVDNNMTRFLDLDPNSGLREETAENKSCIADIEVRVLGYDAMIKILSRRRPGQLIKMIAALEDLQFSILHTNITTIEQTVLYSFNVKITDEGRCTADEIASSVQQILSFIDTSTI